MGKYNQKMRSSCKHGSLEVVASLMFLLSARTCDYSYSYTNILIYCVCEKGLTGGGGHTGHLHVNNFHIYNVRPVT